MAADPLSDATRILGERVRRHREALGVSQEKFAEIARVHWTFVSQVERGIRNVSLHNLLKLAAGFGIDAAELVADLKPPDKPTRRPANAPKTEAGPEKAAKATKK